MTTPSPELPLYVDSTMLSCFRSCPQKFYTEFCLGLRPSAISIDLHAGACFAAAIERVQKLIHSGEDQQKALMVAHAAFLQEWGEFEILKDTPKTPDRVWEAVEEYFRHWGAKTDPVQPYILNGEPAFEFTFAVPLEPADAHDDDGITFPIHPSGQPFIYSGRFDMLGNWNGKPIVRDEKTTKSIASNWADQWALRAQFMGYCWACQQTGLAVDTVCVRGVGILKTKISLVEAYKTYSQELIARWLEQTRRDLWRMRRMWDEGRFDYNFGDACSAYGGCVFRDLCTSPHPERWYSQFAVRRWNPLHKDPTDQSKEAA